MIVDLANKAQFSEDILSNRIEEIVHAVEFGKGLSLANLKNFRKFYLTFPDGGKSYALRSFLTWTHHRLIIRVESPSAREYYIKHAEQENWSTRTLERQIETHSYQRLLSTQTTPVSAPETLPATPSIRDFIKDPYVLEFLGLPQDPAASETEVESAIISISPQRQRTTLRLQRPHRPPHRGRTHRRTRTRTPRDRGKTEPRRHMTHSKSGIQNSPSRATTTSPRNDPARPVRGFPASALFAGALTGRSMSFDAIS